MRSYERNGVTIDQCSECRGIFLDRGELERLVDAENAWHGAQQPEAPRQQGYQQPSYGAPPAAGWALRPEAVQEEEVVLPRRALRLTRGPAVMPERAGCDRSRRRSRSARRRGPGAQPLIDDLVAVLEERPGRPVGERRPARAPFQVSSRNEPRWSRSGPETVPDAYRSPVRSDGAVDGEVGQLLRGGPVHAGERRPGHHRAVPRDLERRGPSPHGSSTAGSRQHRRVLRRGGAPGPRRARPAARPTARSTWRTTCRGTGRAAGTPTPGCRGRDQSLTSTTPKTWSREVGRRGTGVPSADGTPTTKPTSASMSSRVRRAERRAVGVGGLALPARPHDVGARHDDRAGPAVVADRQVPPVRRQRLAVGAEQPADVRGVVLGGVEVDVVGDLERQVQRHLGQRDQQRLDDRSR